MLFVRMYSAYMLHPTDGWIANHRLPLESAITFCREYRRHTDVPVALVPDGADPTPFLRRAEKLA